MKPPFSIIPFVLMLIGMISFLAGLLGNHPERAWQAYLINFLLWSAIAQGGLLFSAVMTTTNARWSGALSTLSESFAAFFPISIVLFILLFLGKNHVFPWLHHDLHGKEVWLNLPFLFSRNLIGLFILYGLGFAYLYNALGMKLQHIPSSGGIRQRLHQRWSKHNKDPEFFQKRMKIFAILYIVSFTATLSLIGYDLVMSMDPHWYSTLFGAYHFVKAFYVGLGGLTILAFILYLKPGTNTGLTSSQFHNMGKLLFAFCLMWADFFYVQFVVIWYGNIPEETSYIIERTMMAPWNSLAWAVFIICFAVPFVMLLNKQIKTKPIPMLVICGLILIGIWLEHFLLLGPVYQHDATSLSFSFADGFITLAFLSLMVISVIYFLKLFPEAYMMNIEHPTSNLE
jgi:hypothetical protein